MEYKMPYYMMYPTPLLFDDSRKEEQDYAYLKSMYPGMAKQILPYVEEECDRMEYDNSMIFDEYPDKLQLRLMGGRIYKNVVDKEKFPELSSSVADASRRRPTAGESCNSGSCQNVVRDMVELLLYQEILRRRCSRRRCCHKKMW